MKKIGLLAWALVLFAGLTACSNDPDEGGSAPQIKLGQSEVILPSDGTVQMIGYMVENAVEGESLTATCEADWLTIGTSKVRSIELSATPNESGKERSTTVELHYKGAQSLSLSVKQLNYESPFTIEVTKVGATDITFSVITSDSEIGWIPMVVTKEYFDIVESDEELYQEDLEYYRYLAEDIREVSLEEFLSQMLAFGTMEDVYFEDLTPETEYVLYTYGLTTEGRRTTDVVWVEFTTEAPHQGDLTFTFEVYEENYGLEFSVIPSHTGVPYYHGIVDEHTLQGWMETYNTDDLREAIQLGDIQESIQYYIDMEWISDAEGYFDMYTEDGVMNWGWENLAANTKYIIYAAKWNEDCELVGEISTYEHLSASVAASDNRIALTVSDITQSSARVSSTTTNDDPYVMIPVRSSEIAGKSDAELFAYMVTSYDYLLSEYTYEGDYTKTFSYMRPDTDYTILAFGYLGKSLTTQIWKYEIKTLSSGAPEDCTFEFHVEPDTDNAWVEVTPSDKGHFYHWMVYPATYTADDVKNFINLLIENYYEGDPVTFASWELSQGDESATAWDLYADTDYKVGAVVMDYDTGNFLGEVFFSEVFTTSEVTYADLTIHLNYGPYYDLNALVASGLTEYEDDLEFGDALLPISVTVDGDCTEFYYDIYKGDHTNVETNPDGMYYDGLWYGCFFSSSTFVVSYDTPMTLMAIAYDSDYNASVIVRQLLNFSLEGASPVEDFIASTAPAAKRSLQKASAAKQARVERKLEGEKRLSSPEVEARKQEAEADLRDARKAELQRKLDIRNRAHAARNPYGGRKLLR